MTAQIHELSEEEVIRLEEEVVIKLLREYNITPEENRRRFYGFRAELEYCPECEGTTLLVFQCHTGCWEVWAKCLKCGNIFCLGTE